MPWNLRRGCVAPLRFCDERKRPVTSGRPRVANGLSVLGNWGALARLALPAKPLLTSCNVQLAFPFSLREKVARRAG